MGFQFGVGVLAAFTALALQVDGVADIHLASRVLGGADCTHSDSMEFDCEEINGRTSSCGFPSIVNPEKQSCLDLHAESAVRCTGTNCKNATIDLALTSTSAPTCTKVGCGG